MKKLLISILIIFIILFIVFYSVLAQEYNCTQLTMIHGIINVDDVNITVVINNETCGWQLSQNGSYIVGLDNTNIPKNGSVLATLAAEKQGYVPFTETFNISCGDDIGKNITMKFCDFDGDGIIIHDYNDLMASYKCFLGIKNCNNYYQNWNLIKREYNCFIGN